MNSFDFLAWCQNFTDGDSRSLPLVMGILNITPDSFSDGGRYLSREDALKRVEIMLNEGVDIIDVGGESTRPGAGTVSVDEELSRVIPMIESIRAYSDITISIDTSKPQVMQEAVKAGATFINDVCALSVEGAMDVASQLNVPVCLMHKQGVPETMQAAPYYPQGVVSAINAFFAERIEACLAHGIARTHLILDPGFGFGKSAVHNFSLTKQLASFKSYGLPVLYAASRKATIGEILNRPVSERLSGSLALAIYAMLQGANIIRTHDVAATKDAMTIVMHVENVIE